MAIGRITGGQGGFTLLEMMVVIAIIGVMAAGVAFSVSGNNDRRLGLEAERLRDTLQLAVDQSVLDGADMGVYVTKDSYAFLRYSIVSHQWQSFSEGAFKRHVLPDHLALSLELAQNQMALPDDGTQKPRPMLFFLSSGERDPFILTLTDTAHNLSAPMGSDGISRISLLRKARS